MAVPGLIKKGAKRKKTLVPVGTYDSVIISASYSEEYVDGEAFVLSYELQDNKGNKYSYSETFINDVGNARTAKFDEYLDANGVALDDITELKGLTEKVTIKKQVVGSRSYLNIVDREFVAWSKP